MRHRFSGSMITIAAATVIVGGHISLSITGTSAQAPGASGTVPRPASALTTAWGEPDLQGIWTDETDAPMQRPAKYASQEFFTDAQRAGTNCGRHYPAGTGARSEGPRPTSPGPTTRCSRP
jgi:hypothetical protein